MEDLSRFGKHALFFSQSQANSSGVNGMAYTIA